MSRAKGIASVRVLPEDVANKIAAGEVVERPASVVKELVENALDAGATRIVVRVVGAGRRLIEVTDNGHGMSNQDAMLAIERHATSKIRKADDLDNIGTFGFRGEALASIAAVSRFELVTRRAGDDAATHIQIDGGILRDVSETGAPVGTRVAVNRLYFNTPVRAKFLKGITTELSHCIDVVQRHALANEGVAFQFIHNDKLLIDIPDHATLRERVALLWGLSFLADMVELEGQSHGFVFKGLVGTPALSRSSRSHQLFFLNRRPVFNRGLQYGFEDGYQGLLTVGRRSVGIVLVEMNPTLVDVNIHPTKREVRFRDERAVRDALRLVVRETVETSANREPEAHSASDMAAGDAESETISPFAARKPDTAGTVPPTPAEVAPEKDVPIPAGEILPFPPAAATAIAVTRTVEPEGPETVQTEFAPAGEAWGVAPSPVYRAVQELDRVALQVFDTYLLVPDQSRLLIIDQHALHERLNFDALRNELEDSDYAAQQLAVPILIDVPPASGRLLEANLDVFARMGIEIEPFGGNSYQITAICHLYDDAKVADAVYRILDELAQGNLFDRDEFMTDILRLATEACRASVKAGDRLTEEEKQALIDGFRRMRPPYTCPHGRPIITELTLSQMEKSFRRRQ